MANLTISNTYLDFEEGEVFNADISLEYDGEELEVTSIKGDFLDIKENRAIDLLNKDWSQISQLVNEEYYAYNTNEKYYGNCAFDDER